MIALILLYFVGKAFYDLAEKNNKGKWLFAILGVGTYYAGQFIAALLIGMGYVIYNDGDVGEINEMLLSVIALPFGVLACWGFYKILQNSWQKKKSFVPSEEVLDANLINQDSLRS